MENLDIFAHHKVNFSLKNYASKPFGSKKYVNSFICYNQQCQVVLFNKDNCTRCVI